MNNFPQDELGREIEDVSALNPQMHYTPDDIYAGEVYKEIDAITDSWVEFDLGELSPDKLAALYVILKYSLLTGSAQQVERVGIICIGEDDWNEAITSPALDYLRSE